MSEEIVLAVASDEEECGHTLGSNWCPPMDKVEELYGKMAISKVLEFKWQCPGRNYKNYPSVQEKEKDTSVYDIESELEELTKPDKFVWVKDKAPKKVASMEDIVAKASKGKRLAKEVEVTFWKPETGKSEISKSKTPGSSRSLRPSKPKPMATQGQEMNPF